jgi:membrane-associated protease RseP (regulator of RpoE activity)
MDQGFDRSSDLLQATEPTDGRRVWRRRAHGVRRIIGRVVRSLPFCLFLLVLTTVTMLVVGVHLSSNFSHHLPDFDLDISWGFFERIFRHPGILWSGGPYAFTLLLILLSHEMGHYIACRFYRLEATYPYFLPAPTLIGTFGALILIKSPFVTREELFDVGVAGPIAGFVVTLPALIIGVWHASWMRSPVPGQAILLGHPWAVGLLRGVFQPSIAASRLNLSPVGCAGYVGLFLTALNLLPVGQLDGGHIVFAVFGKRHHYLSWGACLALISLGVFYWPGWLLFAALLFFLVGLKHPKTLIPPVTPLDGRRKLLAIAALAMFALSLTLTPFAVP